MPEEVNPYASPSLDIEVATDDLAFRKLRGPALGLLVISAFGMVFVLIVVMSALTAMIALLAEGIDPFRKLTLDPGFIFILIMGPANALIFAGAWNMRSGKRYGFCVATAVLGSLPVTPICLGIPFGIWALIVLHRRDVKEAFARNNKRAHVATAISD